MRIEFGWDGCRTRWVNECEGDTRRKRAGRPLLIYEPKGTSYKQITYHPNSIARWPALVPEKGDAGRANWTTMPPIPHPARDPAPRRAIPQNGTTQQESPSYTGEQSNHIARKAGRSARGDVARVARVLAVERFRPNTAPGWADRRPGNGVDHLIAGKWANQRCHSRSPPRSSVRAATPMTS